MRCPKCGFISFDQLPKCVKCGKEFSGITDLVHGTAFSVTAPLFLKIQEVAEAKAFGEDIRISDTVIDEVEVQDPDLEILFEDEEGEVAGPVPTLQMDSGDGDAVKDEIEASTAAGSEEEGEISIDLSQFQNDLEGPALGGVSAVVDGGAKIPRQLPEELSDMSDLAPPSRTSRTAVEGKDDDFDFSLDLDGLGVAPAPAGGRSQGAQPAAASTDDDFDFSLDLGLEELERNLDSTGRKTAAAGFDRPGPGQPKAAGRKIAAADPDLDFDLDLGGLTLDKD